MSKIYGYVIEKTPGYYVADFVLTKTGESAKFRKGLENAKYFQTESRAKEVMEDWGLSTKCRVLPVFIEG